MLYEEKEREHKKLCELKRDILLQEREQKLNEALDKQVDFITIYASPVFKQAHFWGELCFVYSGKISVLLWPAGVQFYAS